MKAKPKTIDEYLANLNAENRAALQKLRQTIKSAAPDAEECISYEPEKVGHASVNLTLNVYSHTIPSMQHEAANDFEKALCG